MPPQWRTIKIPASAYDDAIALRERIARAGVDALPEHLRDRAFDERLGAARGVGIGAIVALGLLALGDLVGSKPKRRSRRK
jgi:hypothetical protein